VIFIAASSVSVPATIAGPDSGPASGRSAGAGGTRNRRRGPAFETGRADPEVCDDVASRGPDRARPGERRVPVGPCGAAGPGEEHGVAAAGPVDQVVLDLRGDRERVVSTSLNRGILDTFDNMSEPIYLLPRALAWLISKSIARKTICRAPSMTAGCVLVTRCRQWKVLDGRSTVLC